jgi:hypothetical protein
MKDRAIILVILFLLCANGYWIFQVKSLENKATYHATHICELDRELRLNQIFHAGMSRENVIGVCESKDLSIECIIDNEIYVDFQSGCPESGRPYCSFKINFSNGTVKFIESGYPCH